MKKQLPNNVFFRNFFIVLASVFFITGVHAQTATYNTAGSFSWTCPAGVTSVTVECWGAGGAGGGVTVANGTGGGGGGGAYTKSTAVAVVAGNSYTVVVGAGGVGVTGAGPVGGNSTFNTATVIANGGGGGGVGTSGAAGAGGAAGTFKGGNGAAGLTTVYSGGGGGGAGSSAAGSNATTFPAGAGGLPDGGIGGTGLNGGNGAGNAGTTIGGGGGGAKNTGAATGRNGGNGANGQVKVTWALCAAPITQPTGLSLTAYSQIIDGSFTAATPAASGYLVVRTATSTAPTNPVNGTSYTAGTIALGGYIESAGASTTFSSVSLNASTQYWYWIFAYNNTNCAGGPLYRTTLPLSGNATTLACGAQTNTASMPLSGSINWSALTWSLGHIPTSCENATVTFTGTNTAATTTVTLDVTADVSVRNLTLINNSTSATKRNIFKTVGAAGVNMVVNGNFQLTANGVLAGDSCTMAVVDTFEVKGNAIVGNATDVGYTVIGSTGSALGQTWIFRGNLTFQNKAYTLEEHTVFVMGGTGTQTITNNTTSPFVDNVLFDIFKVGDGTNTPTVKFAGTNLNAYMNDKGGYIDITANSTLDLPKNYSFNAEDIVTTGTYNTTMYLRANATLRLGGDAGGPPGSNFTYHYPTMNIDPTSTIEYYGDNTVTQTVYNGVSYPHLLITNGSGSGRAQKITTGGLSVSVDMNIKALADLTLGSTVSCVGPLNVLSTGGLYCAANVVSGAGAFTLQTGGYLGMGHAQGITAGAFATGNIQMTGGRSFNTGANYIYNGTVTQITGNGLPSTCNDLTIDNPTTVTIATNQNITGVHLLKQGVFDIGSTKVTVTGTGTMNSTGGKMKANLGILDLNGSSGTAQGLAGSWFVNRNISTLVNSNTTGITVAATAGDTLLISSALLYGTTTTNSVITTNNNLTLLSRDTATARFGEIKTGSNNSITGNVTVERYIKSLRKWRHLAWNTTSSQTAQQSWMDNNLTANGNLRPGYGTIVTDDKATWSANAFDSRSVSGPSVKYYDPIANNYIGIPNTNSYAMNGQSAYFNFVRGDRSCLPSNSTVSTTILRTTGTLKTGNQVFTITANKYGAVGNPYASAIDLRQVDTLNLTSTFYVWDPALTGTYGLGAYQTLYASAGGYKVLPGGGSYGALNSFVDTLESGQAMYVKARSSAGTVTFKEASKTVGARTLARTGSQDTAVYALLSLVDPGGPTLVDGSMAAFGEWSNAVDYDDALKLGNGSENTSFKRENQLLAIERRRRIVADDTLFFNTTGLRVHDYKWVISTDNLNATGRAGILIDKYTNTQTFLNLDGDNTYPFTVINNPASYAADRFMIIFKQPQQTLPVHFVSISAVRNTDKTVTVKWITQNEINMQDYKIEYSADGSNFTAIGTQLPLANNGNGSSYSYLDGHATSANNYYRIRGTSLNGLIQYTAIAKVGPLAETPGMNVYPNPITGNILNINFVNLQKGIYIANVTNKIGQLITTESIKIDNSNIVHSIDLGAGLSKGSYQVSIADASGKITTLPFIVQ